MLLAPFFFAFVACSAETEASDSGGDTADTAITPDSGETGAESDTGDTADSAGDTDTGEPAGDGLLRFAGSATVLDSFVGSETVSFLAEDGAGAAVCEVELTLESTGTRDDCMDCIWAYDVEVTAVETTVDTACAAIGFDDAEALVGVSRGMGFDPEYMGHAPALIVDAGTGSWIVFGYAEWDETTGALTYNRDDGYYPY